MVIGSVSRLWMNGLVLSVATMLAVGAIGCSGPRNFENENDRLRAENLELNRKVASLEEQLSLRRGEVETLRRQVEGRSRAIEGVDPPVLAKLEIGKFSGPIDTDGDGCDDLIRIYLRTLDQRGRMLPVAGRASVHAVVIHEESAGSPRTLARRDYNPDDWTRAYASNFTGTHYTLELPLDEPVPDDAGEVTVKVILTEGSTGTVLSVEQPYPLVK